MRPESRESRTPCEGVATPSENGNELFGKTIIEELNSVLNEAKRPNDEAFKIKLGPKVIEHMRAQNDKTAKPRCDASCPRCDSLCFHETNHTSNVKHDTIHQPGGTGGNYSKKSEELVYKTCSNAARDNDKFLHNDKWECYKDFSKVFPEWKQPSINGEEWPLREYIMATYNERIADEHGRKPCPDVPDHYKRDLNTIRQNIENEIKSADGTRK